MRTRVRAVLIAGVLALAATFGGVALVTSDEQARIPHDSSPDTAPDATALRTLPATEHELELLLLLQERKDQAGEVRAVSARIRAQLDALRNGGAP